MTAFVPQSLLQLKPFRHLDNVHFDSCVYRMQNQDSLSLFTRELLDIEPSEDRPERAEQQKKLLDSVMQHNEGALHLHRFDRGWLSTNLEQPLRMFETIWDNFTKRVFQFVEAGTKEGVRSDFKPYVYSFVTQQFKFYEQYSTKLYNEFNARGLQGQETKLVLIVPQRQLDFGDGNHAFKRIILNAVISSLYTEPITLSTAKDSDIKKIDDLWLTLMQCNTKEKYTAFCKSFFQHRQVNVEESSPMLEPLT